MQSRSGKLKPYRYKLQPRPPKQPLNRLAGASNEKLLTGFVQGREASDLEENYAIALQEEGKDFRFQVEVSGPHIVPGEEKQIDFVVEEIYPIEIDDEWVHKTAGQKEYDRQRDALLNEYLSDYGWHPIERVPGRDVETLEAARQLVQEQF